TTAARIGAALFSPRRIQPQVSRPTFLIVEPEPGEALSTRKLVLETAKFNVITAHSAQEGLDSLRRFPNVDALIFHTGVSDLDPPKFIQAVRRLQPQMQLILLAPQRSKAPEGAQAVLSSHDPQALLRCLRKLSDCGD